MIVPDMPPVYDNISDIDFGHSYNDLVVGIVSCANYPNYSDSGIGCVLITGFHEWIDSIVSKVGRFPKNSNLLGCHSFDCSFSANLINFWLF